MHLKTIVIFSLLISTSAFARIEKTTEEDVLYKVSDKLSIIESHLKNQRVDLTNATFSWSEFDLFQKELMFVAAHDPGTQKLNDLPLELTTGHLTLRLRTAWNKMQESIFLMEGMDKHETWLSLKSDVEIFFKLRDEYFYQSARNLIKSGQLTNKMNQLKEFVVQTRKDKQIPAQLSVRVIDPVIESLATEMSYLNQSVRMLKEFRQPPKVEKKTIYHKELYQELGIFAGAAVAVGMLAMLMGIGLFKLFRKKKPVGEEIVNTTDGFDYSEWLKSFETNLRAFKNVEDKIVENHLEMKHLSDDLREARKKLNLSDNQQDFYNSLEQLNISSPKIEEYFERVNLKKGTEASRKMVHAIVQLCQAIESGKTINVTQEKTFKLLKKQQNSVSKAA